MIGLCVTSVDAGFRVGKPTATVETVAELERSVVKWKSFFRKERS